MLVLGCFVVGVFFSPLSNKIKVNIITMKINWTSENKTFAIAGIIVLGLILQLNRSYFLTATEGTDIYSSLLEIERHLKYDHKTLKKSAKEVGSEPWKKTYNDKRTQFWGVGGAKS